MNLRSPIVVGVMITAVGCLDRTPHTITYTASNNSKINNGFVLESAVINMQDKSNTLALPVGTTVHVSDNIVHPQLIIKKELAIYGHPTEFISIDKVYNELGVTTRLEVGCITIATFGEYSNDGHGGAFVSIIAIVPPGIRIIFKKGLSGPESFANRRDAEETTADAEWIKVQTYPYRDERQLFRHADL